MQDIADSHTLLLFPCCGSKLSGGTPWDESGSKLSRLVPQNVFEEIVAAREDLLKTIQNEERYFTDKYKKNVYIRFGPDFNGTDATGKYRPAINRYIGFLYTETPELPELITRRLLEPDAPHLLILSALYGPLHPFDIIQDYDLKMGDHPARTKWRKKIFPLFLKEYIQTYGIKHVELFFGHSTEYLKVARGAILPLLNAGILSEAVQYWVDGGNTQATPKAHGRILASRLKGNIKPPVLRRPLQSFADKWLVISASC